MEDENKKPTENTEQLPRKEEVETAKPQKEKVHKPKSSRKSFVTRYKKPLIAVGVIVVILVPIVGFLLMTNAKNTQVYESRKAVFQALKKSDYAGAQKAAKEGMSFAPNDPYLVKGLIDGATAQGNASGTEKQTLQTIQPEIDKLVSADSKNADALLSAGYAYEIAGEYDRALSYYEQAIAIDPNSGIANFHKGHVLAFLNRKDESNALLLKAYELDPNNGYIQLVRGNLYLENGKTTEALNMFAKSSENNNSSPSQKAEALTTAAMVSLKIGNIDKSVEFAKKATDLNPQYSLGWGVYGYNLSYKNKVEQGLSYIDNAIKLNPRISINYMLMGILLRRVHGFMTNAARYQENGIQKVEEDNTLVGIEKTNSMKAIMYYELAKTYSMVPDDTKTLQNIQLAMGLANYRKQFQEDVRFGPYFSNVKLSPNIQKYME